MAKAIYIVILMNDRDMTLLNHYHLKTASPVEPTISKRFFLDFDLKTNHTHLSDKSDIGAYLFWTSYWYGDYTKLSPSSQWKNKWSKAVANKLYSFPDWYSSRQGSSDKLSCLFTKFSSWLKLNHIRFTI